MIFFAQNGSKPAFCARRKREPGGVGAEVVRALAFALRGLQRVWDYGAGRAA